MNWIKHKHGQKEKWMRIEIFKQSELYVIDFKMIRNAILARNAKGTHLWKRVNI